MQGVYQFVTRKTTNQKHLAQQRALIQSRTRISPISELSPKTSEMNICDIVAKTIAAIQSAQGAKPRGDRDQPRAKSPVLSQASVGSTLTAGDVVRMAIRSATVKITRRCSRRMVALVQRG